MVGYRLYCVDSAGKFVSAGYVDANTDNEAFEMAQAWESGGAFDVWDRERYVGTVALLRID